MGAQWKTKDGARVAHAAARGVVLVKPLSFMNESGIPVQRIAAWWKAAPADILVVSDDLDLPFGRLRMRASGGSGGHNGLKSIIAHLGEGFARLRIGIGRGGFGGRDSADAESSHSTDAESSDAIGHVLSRFSQAEERSLATVAEAAADAALQWLDEGPVAAMNVVNAWRLP